MSKEITSKLISCKDAGLLAGGLHPNTLRQRKAGTENFTHVQLGRRVMLIREEVEKWIENRIAQAQVDERQRRKNFRILTAGK